MIVPFSCSLSRFFYDFCFKFPSFFLLKNNKSPFKVSLYFHCFFKNCFQDFSPAAPSTALAAPERPSLPTVGTTVTAARVAAHWRTSPLVVVVVEAGSAAPLRRRELAGEPERCRRRDGSGRRSRRLPSCRTFFSAGAGAGTMDSSRVLLFAGSPSSPPLARSAISFLAATLLAVDVRWTPSPAQMLVPSTVVRS
jgi:hypothetical protein